MLEFQTKKKMFTLCVWMCDCVFWMCWNWNHTCILKTDCVGFDPVCISRIRYQRELCFSARFFFFSQQMNETVKISLWWVIQWFIVKDSWLLLLFLFYWIYWRRSDLLINIHFNPIVHYFIDDRSICRNEFKMKRNHHWSWYFRLGFDENHHIIYITNNILIAARRYKKQQNYIVICIYIYRERDMCVWNGHNKKNIPQKFKTILKWRKNSIPLSKFPTLCINILSTFCHAVYEFHFVEYVDKNERKQKYKAK